MKLDDFLIENDNTGLLASRLLDMINDDNVSYDQLYPLANQLANAPEHPTHTARILALEIQEFSKALYNLYQNDPDPEKADRFVTQLEHRLNQYIQSVKYFA